MSDTFKINITIDKFLQDSKSFEEGNPSFEISYPEFVNYFRNISIISKHDLIIGINFTYGWMPTIFDFRSDKIDESIIILNKAKNGIVPTENELITLKELFNNSLVGTSKLLHFINPERFAILDSRVIRYLTGKEPNSNIGNCKTYLLFLDYCIHITQSKEFDIIHNSICKKLGYKISKLRTADLIMYSKGAK